MGRDETAGLANALTQEELITTLAHQLFPDNQAKAASLIGFLKLAISDCKGILLSTGHGKLSYDLVGFELDSSAMTVHRKHKRLLTSHAV